MSLFGGLPSAKSDLGSHSSAPVSIGKRALLAPPPSILRNKKRKNDDTGTDSNVSGPTSLPGTGLPASYGVFSAFGTIEQEYDPAVPNDYEKAKRDQEQAVLEAEMEARKASEQREQRDAGPARNPYATNDPEPDPDGGGRGLGLGNGVGLGFGSTGGLGSGQAPGMPEQGAGTGGSGGMSVAMRLMQGMGWSEGEGLGKERQGMATPIILQKTDKRTGVIVNAEPLHRPRQGAVLSGPPSKVVLLRNMVSPGSVDEGLEDEIAEELSKFGDVQRVLIFEVSGNVVPEQAVRIFVEMDRSESATKAVVALQGRFFDGKTISATFFDEDRFAKMELAPRPEELQP